MKGVWKSRKTGKQYLVTGIRKDATNGRDGQVVVCYENDEHEYVREVVEFMNKFTLIEFYPEILPAHREALMNFSTEHTVQIPEFLADEIEKQDEEKQRTSFIAVDVSLKNSRKGKNQKEKFTMFIHGLARALRYYRNNLINEKGEH